MAREVRFARRARQVPRGTAHERLQIGMLEPCDGPVLCFGERSAHFERIALGQASSKTVPLAQQIAHADSVLVAESRSPRKNVAQLADIARKGPSRELRERVLVDRRCL